MKIEKNVSLSSYSTMRLGGKAAYLAKVASRLELEEAIIWAADKELPLIMIGVGSNIVWSDQGFEGLVIVNRLLGYDAALKGKNDYFLTVGAGENWDKVVERTVAEGATGIEALSLIPGTAGSTPVQNVGAYGQEIAQTLVSLEAYDTQLKKFVTISRDDCDFGYRSSRFKTHDRGRFFITSILFHLHIGSPNPPYYPALQHYLDKHHITDITPIEVRRAVIAIRQQKMPDPKDISNNGSFFANPIIGQVEFNKLVSLYPEIVHWPMGDREKLSAAWLIEQSGFSDFHDKETGMATWAKQPLVLVNEHAKTTADLEIFKQKIVSGVQEKFGITLTQEPESLP